MIHPAASMSVFVSVAAIGLFIATMVALVVEHRRRRAEDEEYHRLMDRITSYRRDFGDE